MRGPSSGAYFPRITDAKVAHRFWGRVDWLGGPDTCWEWRGPRDAGGYGLSRYAQRTQRAHRMSYALAKGDILAGLVVRHRCNNPACVNPRHLMLGTQADNMRDSIARGTNPGARTHCPQGHAYDAMNTARWRDSESRHRHCRTCNAERQRRRRAAQHLDLASDPLALTA